MYGDNNMANKKVENHDIEDLHGPMNSVAKEDAKIWTGLEHKKESEYELHEHRTVVAKKQKAKKSSKKQDRRISKQLVKQTDERQSALLHK